jgi:serine protease inhibitor
MTETDRAHLAFTLALHRAAAPDLRANACWSPYSVASALGLVALGAKGMTRDELTVLLLGEKSGDLRSLGRLLARAATLRQSSGDEEPVLAVANRLWTDAAVEIQESYVDGLGEWPSGSVRPAPFRDAPEQARDLINNDVKEITRGLIPELVPAGAIRRDTVAALINALYLKCAWRNRFADGATGPRPFHGPGGTVEVPTMELSERLGYNAVNGWQVVSLPAVGGVRAVVLLPDADLATAEPALDAGSLGTLLVAPRATQVNLRLPKLDVKMRAELTSALTQLGVQTMFTDDADLSGINPDLAVQAVLHESVLKVDEEGFEGAAATAVMFRTVGMIMDEPVTVDVDRPFLLLIQHEETGVIYFAARVNEP